jgi:hypothetical protein
MGKILIPSKNTPDKDIIMTPVETAVEIINHFNPSGKILDPCRGTGAFYDNFPTTCQKDWCELSEDKDFFDYHDNVDWIITNPPWSKIKEFMIHSIKIANEIVYLISINHYTTKARLRIIKNSGFGIKEIYCIKSPPSPWPQSGFQIAAIHISKGYIGDIVISGTV